MSILRSLFISLLFAPPIACWAARHPSGVPTPFFRSPDSAFASGQATRSELQKRIKSEEFQSSLKVSWNKKIFNLPAENAVQEIHCASQGSAAEGSMLYEKELSASKEIGFLEKDQAVEILQVSGAYAQVKNLKNQKVGWLPHKRLLIKKEDGGVFVNLIDSFLRKKASHDSAIVTTVPKAQRLKIVGYDNGFLKTEYHGYVGYVDLSHLVSRADFAFWAYHEDRWVPVRYRQNEFLMSSESKKIPLDEITAYGGSAQKAVVLNSEDGGPPVRSHVQITEAQAHRWALSELPGHGLVWWKKDEPENSAKAAKTETVLSAQEILKRPLFAMALESGKKIRGLISSQGIFRTEDGVRWRKIEQFGNQDLPVSVHPDGYWFVGSYKSVDRGETFEPFIRWDLLAEIIENYLGRHPRQIRLQKLESLPQGRLQVLVDTSPGHVQLRYQIGTSAWSLVK